MDSMKNRTIDVHNRNSGVRTRNTYSDLMDPDDCHKKRCLDRYDSSESSDSGVVLLSNGSNCDLSDPYSPSNSSSLSSGFYNEDIEVIKMPPTTSDKNTLTTNWLSFINLINHGKETSDDSPKTLDTLPNSMNTITQNLNNNATCRPKDKSEETTTLLPKETSSTCQQMTKQNRRPHQQKKLQSREQDRQQYQQQLQINHNQQRQRQRQRQYQLQEETGPYICHWKDCGKQFTSGSSALLEHLQISHIIAQANAEHYICHWINCKVYNKPSCSLSWLERHVLSHGSKWPFRCIVGGCGAFFSTQTLLEKHVNSHFNTVQNTVNNQNVSSNRENVLRQQQISEESDTVPPTAIVYTSTRCNRVTRMNQNNNCATVAVSNPSISYQVSSSSSAKSNVGGNSHSSISTISKTKTKTKTNSISITTAATNAMITTSMTTITPSTNSVAVGNSMGSSVAMATKVSKKSYKRVRLRRQIPYSVRTFDYFDDRIMGIVGKHLAMNYYPIKSNICQEHCQLHNRLQNHVKITRNNNRVDSDSDNDDDEFIEFRSLVKGSMTDSHGTKLVLLQWIPENILPDEWVLETQMENYRTISARTYQSLLKRRQLQSSSLLSPTMKTTPTNSTIVSSSAQRRKYPKRYCNNRS